MKIRKLNRVRNGQITHILFSHPFLVLSPISELLIWHTSAEVCCHCAVASHCAVVFRNSLVSHYSVSVATVHDSNTMECHRLRFGCHGLRTHAPMDYGSDAIDCGSDAIDCDSDAIDCVSDAIDCDSDAIDCDSDAIDCGSDAIDCDSW